MDIESPRALEGPPHIDPDRLLAHVEGRSDLDEAALTHVDACPTCQGRWAVLGMSALLREADYPAHAAHAEGIDDAKLLNLARDRLRDAETRKLEATIVGCPVCARRLALARRDAEGLAQLAQPKAATEERASHLRIIPPPADSVPPPGASTASRSSSWWVGALATGLAAAAALFLVLRPPGGAPTPEAGSPPPIGNVLKGDVAASLAEGVLDAELIVAALDVDSNRLRQLPRRILRPGLGGVRLDRETPFTALLRLPDGPAPVGPVAGVVGLIGAEGLAADVLLPPFALQVGPQGSDVYALPVTDLTLHQKLPPGIYHLVVLVSDPPLELTWLRARAATWVTSSGDLGPLLAEGALPPSTSGSGARIVGLEAQLAVEIGP